MRATNCVRFCLNPFCHDKNDSDKTVHNLQLVSLKDQAPFSLFDTIKEKLTDFRRFFPVSIYRNGGSVYGVLSLCRFPTPGPQSECGP